MRSSLLLLLTALFCSACTPTDAVSPGKTIYLPAQQQTTLPTLSPASKKKIGNKIWQNESGGKISGLTAWNKGEEFPSLGIGHFIWYPKGFNGRWTESFPSFIKYAQQQGRKDIPAWVLKSPDCPWPTRESFQQNMSGAHLTSLRNFLANSIELQTDFILTKSRAALPKMLVAAPLSDHAKVKANYAKLAAIPNGAYALIDYVNFKGEGINLTERYKGQGWGLLQVLQEMKPTSGGQATAREFSNAAKRVLDRRIKNSPVARGEKRWKAGWHNRCNTYAQPL